MAIRERTGISARELTTLQVGGICKTVFDVTSTGDIYEVFDLFPEAICIGGGSNLLVSERGVTQPIIRIYSDQASMKIDSASGRIKVDASVEWDKLVAGSLDAGLVGLEGMSGIPGSVGGGVVQNVGAYGQEVADVFVSLTAWDRDKGSLVNFSKDEVAFAYRNSRFKHDPDRRFVVTSVELQLQRSPMGTISYADVAGLLQRRHGTHDQYETVHIREAVLAVRQSKGMLIDAGAPSAGSFFTNPEITPAQLMAVADRPGVRVLKEFGDRVRVSAASLIAASGFEKGMHHSGAAISAHHVLAIVNNGGATSDDIVGLATQIRTTVFENFGIALKAEPVTLGFDQDPFPALG